MCLINYLTVAAIVYVMLWAAGDVAKKEGLGSWRMRMLASILWPVLLLYIAVLTAGSCADSRKRN